VWEKCLSEGGEGGGGRGEGGGRGARACVRACVRACTRRLTCPLLPDVYCLTSIITASLPGRGIAGALGVAVPAGLPPSKAVAQKRLVFKASLKKQRPGRSGRQQSCSRSS
jgi:hypothetical protein